MAQDGYPPRSTNSPPSYEYSDPRTQYPQSHYPYDTYRSSSRQASRERGIRNPLEHIRTNHHQRPIDEAVSTAFDTADTSGINPELIAQITQNVIRQLRVSGETGTPITATQAQYPPPPSQQQPYPTSPSIQSDASPPMPTRNVYTPPSPHRHTEYPNHGSPESRASIPRGSPPTTYHDFEERRPSSRVSVSSEASNTRPSAPTREPTSSKEETILEKIWGQLFDKDGNSTPRLSQFLRGLAVHLIEDYEPKHSLVVTPTKLARFYKNISLSKEFYPWSEIFDHSISSISRMYRELECQHHLVQDLLHLNERPDIPGLTPVGFEKWITLMIKAHPEEEFERLQKAVLEMPINNPDNTKERFPKEVPRRLFPTSEDFHTRDQLVAAIEEHCHVTIDAHHSAETPRPLKPEVVPPRSFPDASPASDAPYPPSGIERERKPYSSIPNESAIDDTNHPTTQPIERERKPYRSTPGGGRVYEDQDGRATMPGPGISNPASAPPPVSMHRANSSSSRPVNVPPPPGAAPRQGEPGPEIHQMRHRASVSARRRNHSPSASVGANDFRRSDTDLRGFQPGSYGTPLSRSQTVHESGESGASGIYEDDAGRRYGREGELRRGDYARGGSPSRRYGEPAMQERRQGMGYPDEDYYRNAGRRDGGGRGW